MDILIRILIMIMAGGSIPFIANIIYKPFNDIEKIKEMNIIEKILWGLFYIFILNWTIYAPVIVFFNCFKYFFTN